jgi:hypothetical protein
MTATFAAAGTDRSSEYYAPFSIAQNTSETPVLKYDYTHMGKRHSMCATTIVGASSLTLGLCGIFGGFVMIMDAGAAYAEEEQSNTAALAMDDRHENTGKVIMVVGAGLSVVGLGMTIGGAIYDHSGHRNRWSLVSPKPNNIGLAYSF